MERDLTWKEHAIQFVALAALIFGIPLMLVWLKVIPSIAEDRARQIYIRRLERTPLMPHELSNQVEPR